MIRPSLLFLVLLATSAAVAQPVTRAVDTSASRLEWRGTKFRGHGSHEGTLRFRSGHLTFGPGGTLTGAAFEVALATLAITDIPESDPVPRRQLRAHLLEEDFFWADRHPLSTLRTTRVVRQSGGRYRVEALLTMRGVARPVAFDAVLTPGAGGRVTARASLRVLRSGWEMHFGLFPGDDLFVDDAFTFDVALTAR